MKAGDKVMFQPSVTSMAREIGEIVSVDGFTVVIHWNGQDYTRDTRTDFIRPAM